MRVYHFTGRKSGLDDIRRRRIKIATINDVNDPFELLAPASPVGNVRRRFRITKAGLADTKGMLCFSRDWKNPVQWSHYAEGHRGLCLGFEIPASLLIKIQYRRKRLRINVAAIDAAGREAEVEMQKVLRTKYIHWRYEKEMRLFTELDERDTKTGLYFADFSPNLVLKEVIIGHSSTITRQEIKLALGDLKRQVAVCKARLAFNSYKVVKQRNSNLWD
jgi:DUF2971 family protein